MSDLNTKTLLVKKKKRANLLSGFSPDKLLFPGSDLRTTLLKKNIFYSFILKILSIAVSFLLVPLTLNYLSVYEYGLWLTLSSVFTWINYFDIGLGNGLRNKLAEAFAEDDNKLGQIYISTTFFILALIVTILFLGLLVLNPFLDWSAFLNSGEGISNNLNQVVIVAFAFFGINFVFKIIGIVYTAAQRPAINDLILFLGNLLSLILIYTLTKVTDGSLLKVALAFSAAPVIILVMAYPLTFRKLFYDFRPTVSAIKLTYAKDLLNLGIQFFILQISALILFGMSNVIISKTLGPDQVTPYNIAFKYFSIATMGFNIIISPMWAASTDAYVKGEIEWIKQSMKAMLKISILSTAFILLLILGSSVIYQLWIGDKVHIPLPLTVWMGIYTTIILWSTCFSTFLFGIGKLRLQLINTVTVSILFIPVALLLNKQFGVTGTVIALCLMNISGAVLNPIQYYKIVRGTAVGIWNK